MINRRQFLGTALIPLAGTVFAQDTNATLTDKLKQIEASTGGRLGVSVLDTGSGKRAGHRENERFAMCSTFKFLASALVLSRVDKGLEQLERRIVFKQSDLVDYSPAVEKHLGGTGMSMAELCEAAVTLSDNTAANTLLKSFGGPRAFTSYARSLGDKFTRLDRIEPALNEARVGDPRDTTTPAAMADTMRKTLLGDALTPASRATLLRWLDANTTGGERIRAGVPTDWIVGDKTGTGNNGTANDIAIIRPPGRAPIMLTVYLTGSKGTATERSAAIASVARAVSEWTQA